MLLFMPTCVQGCEKALRAAGVEVVLLDDAETKDIFAFNSPEICAVLPPVDTMLHLRRTWTDLLQRASSYTGGFGACRRQIQEQQRPWLPER